MRISDFKFQIPNFKSWSALLALILASAHGSHGQIASGGSFNLQQTVIASGGGSNSSGGSLMIDGTVGQTNAGTLSAGGNFTLRGGFWALNSLAPTAARVSISGRVLTASGQGIRNATVKLTDGTGTIRTAQTATFGFYRFDEVAVGQTYILEISSRKFTFSNPTRVLSVNDEIADADFIADEK